MNRINDFCALHCEGIQLMQTSFNEITYIYYLLVCFPHSAVIALQQQNTPNNKGHRFVVVQHYSFWILFAFGFGKICEHESKNSVR